MDCPEESQRDIGMLARGDLPAADLRAERIRYLTERGIASDSGKRVRLVSGFLRQIKGEKEQDISGVEKCSSGQRAFGQTSNRS